jgi:phenylalanyl-tRNA synthetase alpha chain
MFSPLEVTLIKALEVGKKYRVEEAAKISKMSVDAVFKAAYLLQDKGLARVEEEKWREYSLTEEGMKYLNDGFPEEIIARELESIDSCEKSVAELEKKFGKDLVSIAIGWLRRKGCIEIKDGVVKLIKPVSIPEREALNEIYNDRMAEVDEDVLKILVRRKLIRIEEFKETYITLLKKPEAELKGYVSDLTPELIISGAWRGKEFLKYDIHVPSKDIFPAKVHPYERIIRECRKIFLEMGFTEIKGHYVQSAFWNFDALFQPQDHPARDMQDTFYLDRYIDMDDEVVERVRATHENGWITGSTGWGGEWSYEKAMQLVLRTHTTAITIHYLARNPEPPVKAFCIDRVYRREAIDATHLPEFDQLEGVVLDRNVGFKHLLGLLKEFFVKMGFEDVRFRPGYFPYTEPSVEPEVYVDGLGWIELGGAGVFRKEVTEPLGIKGKVLAWGLGIGRLAMLRLGMKDLRRLYLPDIGWLRDVPAVKR